MGKWAIDEQSAKMGSIVLISIKSLPSRPFKEFDGAVPLELGLDLRQRLRVSDMGHQEIEALAEHFFPVTSGQLQKTYIGRNDRIVGFPSIGRPAVVPQTLRRAAA